MNVNEFLIENELRTCSELAEMIGCDRATISKRYKKGWQIDYYIVDGKRELGWLKPDGMLFFEGYI